mmetsp:Transcript_27026/g.41448  ORF Transcript_27026/g.41448 Transcript_27026/m.41448 type:complete len:108 (+) Transcript_27026:260-583(+)
MESIKCGKWLFFLVVFKQNALFRFPFHQKQTNNQTQPCHLFGENIDFSKRTFLTKQGQARELVRLILACVQRMEWNEINSFFTSRKMVCSQQQQQQVLFEYYIHPHV